MLLWTRTRSDPGSRLPRQTLYPHSHPLVHTPTQIVFFCVFLYLFKIITCYANNYKRMTSVIEDIRDPITQVYASCQEQPYQKY